MESKRNYVTWAMTTLGVVTLVFMAKHISDSVAADNETLTKLRDSHASRVVQDTVTDFTVIYNHAIDYKADHSVEREHLLFVREDCENISNYRKSKGELLSPKYVRLLNDAVQTCANLGKKQADNTLTYADMKAADSSMLQALDRVYARTPAEVAAETARYNQSLANAPSRVAEMKDWTTKTQ